MPAPQLVSNPRRNSYHGLEEATQTWIEGDFLTLDATTGEVELYAFDSQAPKILGLAQAAASGVTSTAAVVTQIWPGDILAIDTYTSAGGGAAKDAADDIPGNLYELLSIGTGASRRWYAEFSPGHSGGTALLICEGEVQGSLKDKINGTTRYRALFRVLDSVLLQHVGQ